MGAGASIEFGMPSVDEIDKLFEEWATRCCCLTNSTYNESLYTWVRNKMNRDNPEKNNFEQYLHTIQRISSLEMDANFIEIKDFPEIRNANGVVKIADTNDFSSLNKHLNSSLLDYLRSKCRNLGKEGNLNMVKKFFKLFENEFELGFVNLNYDNVLLSALPNLKHGFDSITGKFKMVNLYKNEWSFCYHLHGSVHFDMRDNEEIFWNRDLASDFGYGPKNRRGITTQEGSNHPLSTIITGLDKINQIYREPFRQYFLKLDQRIYESDAILFIGYGFNDSYINKLIRTHSIDKSKRRNIVVIDYLKEELPSLSEGGNEWGHRLLETAFVPYFQMGNGSTNVIYRPDNVGEYKKTRTFEFSDNYDNPLYVWYSGFMEACLNKEKVMKALKGYFYEPNGSLSSYEY